MAFSPSLASSLVFYPLFSSKPSPFPRRRSPARRRNARGRSPISASSSPSFRNGSTPPETECPVPWEQQPVNEYQSLSSSLLFSWAAADPRLYASRLAAVGGFAALFVGFPVSAFGVPLSDPRCALGAVSAGLLAVTLAVLRMYLGWAYVGNRLLSATVEYEETGWYDGQIWVKTPEVLARDRLLGSFSVKPVLNRVKLTLVGLAVSLVACGLVFINIENTRGVSNDVGERAIAGTYSDTSARSFEPDAFCGEPDLS